jgi:hypothetical protein
MFDTIDEIDKEIGAHNMLAKQAYDAYQQENGAVMYLMAIKNKKQKEQPEMIEMDEK